MKPNPKPPKYRNKKYLDWIKKQPCLICSKKAEPHHVRHTYWGSGIGTKSHDYCALPLCRIHHKEEHSMPFLDKTLVEIERIIINFLMRYIEEIK